MKSAVSRIRVSPLVRLLFGMSLVLRAVAQETTAEYEQRKALQAAGIYRDPHGTGNTPAVPSGGLMPAVSYFPPPPPVYGAVIPEPPRVVRHLNGRDLSAPEDLADFVGEIFYPALGVRLFEKSLGKKLEARLTAYGSTRMALLDEMMEELYRLQNASAVAREEALQALATRQAPRIAAFEEEAERLRRDMIQGGFWAKKVEWDPGRAWRLGGGAVANPPVKHEAEFQVVRAAAFFQDGFLIEQRGLLRELAIELARTARVARGRPLPADDDPRAVFFSPETARLRMPSPLPPELFTKVSQFNSEKAALKRELLETLVEGDKLSEAQRRARIDGLVVTQGSRIVALEKKAEEIRRQLATSASEPAPWVPPISPGLRERIDSYNRDRGAMIADFTAAQLRAERQISPFGAKGGLLADTGLEQMRGAVQSRAEARRQAASDFETRHAERIDALRGRYEQIRRELAEVARDLEDPQTHRQMTLETLLDAYRVAMQRFDAIGREVAMYERYKLAMLQPGLSPGQRRLLFRAAHASLAQGLPTGEINLGGATQPKPSS